MSGCCELLVLVNLRVQIKSQDLTENCVHGLRNELSELGGEARLNAYHFTIIE